MPMSRDGTATYVTIMTATTAPSVTENHTFPHRSTTMVANPRARPTRRPQAKIVRMCVLASENAGRICGAPGFEIANANTALRKKLPAVSEAITNRTSQRSGPRKM